MEKVYLICFTYENGKRQLLLDPEYMHLPSREQVNVYARQKMQKLNHAYVSSVVGKITAYTVFEGFPVCSAGARGEQIRN